MANKVDEDIYLETTSDSDDISVEAEAGQLIFPINIHESLAATGGLKPGEKRGLVLSLWAVLCFFAGWLLMGWLRGIFPEHYVILVIIVEVVLQLTVGMFLLRWLLGEGTLLNELANEDNSFAKYFSIYRERLVGEGTPYPFDVIEFSDNSYGVYLQFLLGYNTNRASASTYELNKQIVRLINKSGFTYRVIFGNERFSNSEAADYLRNVVSNVSEPQLFGVYRDIVQGLLNTANNESNTLCVTYIIYAKNQIQKDDLPELITSIMNMAQTEESMYRQISVLEYEDIVEFYRLYYKLDILDMGLIRVYSAGKKNIVCPVKVLKVYGKSGKSYTTSEFSLLSESLLADFGLEQVNRVSVKEN